MDLQVERAMHHSTCKSVPHPETPWDVTKVPSVVEKSILETLDMVQSQLSPLIKFLDEELRTLCRDRRTGTLLVVSSNNQVFQFSLKEGEIVALTFQNKHGAEALDVLEALRHQDVRANASRFAEGHLLSSKVPPPATDYILELLRGGNRGGSARPVQDSSPKSLRMTDQTRKILEEELVEFLGPMAVILCDEVWSTAKSLDEALSTLSQELSDPDQADRFWRNVFDRLG